LNSACWNYSHSAWDQSYTNSQSNWSYTELSPPSWGFDNEHEKMRRTLESLESDQRMIESYVRMEALIDKIMTHLNQTISTLNSDQVQEIHQLSQVEFNNNQEGTQPTQEKTFKTCTQLLNDINGQLDR